MKRLISIILVMMFSLCSYCQTTDKQYYIYNIISFDGNLKNEGFKVDIDDGKKIEKLKDAEGNTIKFKTPAAALMYLYSLGWELFINGATSEGMIFNGGGGSHTTSYWIIRKPCSKEDFEKAVQDGLPTKHITIKI